MCLHRVERFSVFPHPLDREGNEKQAIGSRVHFTCFWHRTNSFDTSRPKSCRYNTLSTVSLIFFSSLL